MSRIKNGTRQRENPVVIILIGVSGSGKTTVGKLLAQALSCDFYDGDDFHSAANKEKMNQGIPLSDADRGPWLVVLHNLISQLLAQRKVAVLACSALHQSYRDYLSQPGVQFVYLKGDFELLRHRLENRKGHFFDPKLLANQLRTWEKPKGVLTVEAAKNPYAIVREIQDRLGIGKHDEITVRRV